MHLPVTVQAVLTHDETRAGRTRTRKILQAPHMPAATTSTITGAIATTSTGTRAIATTSTGTGAIATTSTGTKAIATTSTGTTTMAHNPGMTLLTQLRPLAVEQRGMVRTMHLVTQGAVLRDRVVLPQKGPALLGMTGVAVLVYGQLVQIRRSGTAMRVMTVTADHLAFPDGMRGGPEGLGTDILVALEANFSLGGAFAHLVRLVHGMTAATGQVFTFVETGLPVQE